MGFVGLLVGVVGIVLVILVGFVDWVLFGVVLLGVGGLGVVVVNCVIK